MLENRPWVLSPLLPRQFLKVLLPVRHHDFTSHRYQRTKHNLAPRALSSKCAAGVCECTQLYLIVILTARCPAGCRVGQWPWKSKLATSSDSLGYYLFCLVIVDFRKGSFVQCCGDYMCKNRDPYLFGADSEAI